MITHTPITFVMNLGLAFRTSLWGIYNKNPVNTKIPRANQIISEKILSVLASLTVIFLSLTNLEKKTSVISAPPKPSVTPTTCTNTKILFIEILKSTTKPKEWMKLITKMTKEITADDIHQIHHLCREKVCTKERYIENKKAKEAKKKTSICGNGNKNSGKTNIRELTTNIKE
jgi:hypothetical protein